MLEEVRKKINKVDEQLLKLISERVELGKEVALAKKGEDNIYFRPDREQEVLNRIQEINPGVLENGRVLNIFREIMSATLDIQHSLKIGYLGPAGSFTHQAAVKKFGHSLSLHLCKNFDDVFDLVQKKECNYGIIPIENSTEGIVNATLDSLLKYDLNIISEVHLTIHNNLLSYAKSFNEIQKIYSHPQALGQCRNWIQANLKHAEILEVASTSYAAQMVSELKKSDSAAISPALASTIYKLPIVAANIEDYSKNYTRFIVISSETARPAKFNRTSIIFSISDKPGSLIETLKPVMEAGINMTSIESRPSRSKAADYFFYVDLLGHSEQEPLKSTLAKIADKTPFFRILGSYPVDQDLS